IAAGRAGVRRRFAPHQLRHAHAVEMSREGVAAAGHPTCRSRDHLRLLARDRQHRDYPRRPRTASTDDPGDERTEDLSLTDPYWWVVSRTTHRLFASLEAPPGRGGVDTSPVPQGLAAPCRQGNHG